MKSLIVEDDFTSRLLLQELLRPYGPSHVAINGKEATDAVKLALEAKEPYDLICLDIMMPDVNGLQALGQIRAMEEARGVFSTDGAKILMTTALSDMRNIETAFLQLCDGYLVKPIAKEQLIAELTKFGLIT